MSNFIRSLLWIVLIEHFIYSLLICDLFIAKFEFLYFNFYNKMVDETRKAHNWRMSE